MKKILSLFAAVLFAGSMFADPIVINATDVEGIESGATGDFSTTVSGIDLVWNGAYYNNENNQDIRVYAGKTLTLTASEAIQKVEIAGYAKKDLEVSVDNGNVTTGASYSSETTKKTLDDPLIVVEGINAKSVTLSCTKQMRAFIIRVTIDGEVTPPDPQDEGVVYDWAKKVGVTFLGASGVEESKVNIHENTDEVPAIKFGSSYVYEDGKYIAIKPADGGFKAGDKVEFAAVINNSGARDEKYAMVQFYAADGATLLFEGDTVVNGKLMADDPIVESFTLEADQDSILLGRHGTTGMFLTLLKVTRGGENPPVEPEKVTIDIEFEVDYVDMVDEEGWWQFMAENDDYEISISNVATTQAAGVYTIEDLDADYTYIAIKATEEEIAFVDGSLTLSEGEDGSRTIEGELTGSDGNIYAIKLVFHIPTAETTVNVEIPEWGVVDASEDYGIEGYIFYGETEDESIYVQLMILGSNPIGSFTLDDCYAGGTGIEVEGAYKSVYSMDINVTVDDEENVFVTAEILCLNNTLYHVTTRVGEGIDGVNAAMKAVKVLRDGQVQIIKGDKTYNVLGVQVR